VLLPTLSFSEGIYYAIRYFIKSREYPGIPIAGTIKILNQLYFRGEFNFSFA
jgi:hypothetical protein